MFSSNCKEGVITSPAVLIKLPTILADRASNVTVVESNGGNNVFTAEEAFNGHGIRNICKELGIAMINLSNEPVQYVSEEILGKKSKWRFQNYYKLKWTNSLVCQF